MNENTIKAITVNITMLMEREKWMENFSGEQIWDKVYELVLKRGYDEKESGKITNTILETYMVMYTNSLVKS